MEFTSDGTALGLLRKQQLTGQKLQLLAAGPHLLKQARPFRLCALALRDVLADANVRTIGKANVGPGRIDYPPISHAGLEIGPRTGCCGNAIQYPLSFLRVRIEFS